MASGSNRGRRFRIGRLGCFAGGSSGGTRRRRVPAAARGWMGCRAAARVIKRQGKAGIAAGGGGIRIPANSPVIAGVRCADGKEKEPTGGATASAGERCGERAVRGRPGRDARASRAWRAGRTGGGGRARGPCRLSGAESAGWTGPRALVWAGGKEREGLGPHWVLGPG